MTVEELRNGQRALEQLIRRGSAFLLMGRSVANTCEFYMRRGDDDGCIRPPAPALDNLNADRQSPSA
jgi:hypothetical protein